MAELTQTEKDMAEIIALHVVREKQLCNLLREILEGLEDVEAGSGEPQELAKRIREII